MMTATVAALGLVPFLFATGPGSEIERPLAIVVIGGFGEFHGAHALVVASGLCGFRGERGYAGASVARFVGTGSPDSVPLASGGRLASNRSRP